jgi:hypothetical protein
MEIRNIRVLEWKQNDKATHGFGGSTNPFASVADVDDSDVLLRLYDYEPTKEDITRDYSLWKGGIQFVASSLFTSCFKDKNITT